MSTPIQLTPEENKSIEGKATIRFPFGDKSYPSHDANTNARREGFREGMEAGIIQERQSTSKQLQEAREEIERLKELEQKSFVFGYLNKSDWKVSMVDDIASGELREKWNAWEQFKKDNIL